MASVVTSNTVFAQTSQIKWMGFEQLEDSLKAKPKKVFIDFYADWCNYCKKMYRSVFQDPEVISALNSNYYAVKMNAESRDTIVFGGKTFVNKQVSFTRNPTHQIPLLLGSREGMPFSLPLIIILNEKFEVEERYFEYISPQEMKSILKI
jgi:thiol-disulfide isomerase/thioredoxin